MAKMKLGKTPLKAHIILALTMLFLKIVLSEPKSKYLEVIDNIEKEFIETEDYGKLMESLDNLIIELKREGKMKNETNN